MEIGLWPPFNLLTLERNESVSSCATVRLTRFRFDIALFRSRPPSGRWRWWASWPNYFPSVENFPLSSDIEFSLEWNLLIFLLIHSFCLLQFLREYRGITIGSKDFFFSLCFTHDQEGGEGGIEGRRRNFFARWRAVSRWDLRGGGAAAAVCQGDHHYTHANRPKISLSLYSSLRVREYNNATIEGGQLEKATRVKLCVRAAEPPLSLSLSLSHS